MTTKPNSYQETKKSRDERLMAINLDGSFQDQHPT